MSTPLLTNASATVPLGARRGAACFARQASVGASKRLASSGVNVPTLTAPLAARRRARRLCVANVSTPNRHVLIASRSSHRALRPYNVIYLSALSFLLPSFFRLRESSEDFDYEPDLPSARDAQSAAATKAGPRTLNLSCIEHPRGSEAVTRTCGVGIGSLEWFHGLTNSSSRL